MNTITVNSTSNDAAAQHFDVVIVGGGAAGLTAAVTLGRARRSVLVVDSGEPRNAPADGVHMFLTRDGIPPDELVRIGRAEAAYYGSHFVDGAAVAARRTDAGFDVELADGSVISGCWSQQVWLTNSPTCRACGNCGAKTSTTAPTATAGSSTGRRWAFWVPTRWPCTRRSCFGNGCRT